MKLTSIVALIPARGGSERIKRKNVKELGGRPLIAWAILAAYEAGIFDGIYVSTEDEEIKAIAQEYSIDYGLQVIDRPAELATSWSPDVGWVTHALSCLNSRPDAYALLRPTSPFRRGEWIARAWSYLQANPHADSLRALRPVTEHPGKMWSTSVSGRIAQPVLPYRTSAAPWHSCPTQELPRLYVQTAALEIAWTRVLPDSISGDVVLPWLCEAGDPCTEDINSPADWERVERLASEHPEWLPEVRG